MIIRHLFWHWFFFSIFLTNQSLQHYRFDSIFFFMLPTSGWTNLSYRDQRFDSIFFFMLPTSSLTSLSYRHQIFDLIFFSTPYIQFDESELSSSDIWFDIFLNTLHPVWRILAQPVWLAWREYAEIVKVHDPGQPAVRNETWHWWTQGEFLYFLLNFISLLYLMQISHTTNDVLISLEMCIATGAVVFVEMLELFMRNSSVRIHGHFKFVVSLSHPYCFLIASETL